MRRKRDRADEAAAEADRRADSELVGQFAEQVHRRQLQRRDAEHQHEDDGGRVVEPGLGLEQSREPPRQRHHPQDGEHCCGVGDRHDGAEEERKLPVHPE